MTHHDLNRRDLLRGAAAATGGAAALTLSGQASGASPPIGPVDPRPLSSTDKVRFFDTATLDFQARLMIGGAAYGMAELGECIAAFEQVKAAGETYRAFYEQMRALGDRVAEQARDARRRGQRVTARSAHLRAAEYYAQAEFFALASDEPTRAREGEVYRLVRDQWNAFGALLGERFEPVRIPYERGSLPGWFFRAPGRGRKPVVIANNGSDGQMVEVYYEIAAAYEWGFHCLVFEGPGQGGPLFLRNQTFRPDWEKVVRPVVDALVRRDDVDRRRIALTGVSFGGYLAPRAAAFDRRIAALVADPGVIDTAVGWREFPQFIFQMLNEGKDAEVTESWSQLLAGAPQELGFEMRKRIEIYTGDTPAEQLKQIPLFNLEGLVGRIRCPTLVCDPEDEQFYPGQPRRFFDQVTARKRLAPFLRSDGANFHCEPMAPQQRNASVYGFLEEVLN